MVKIVPIETILPHVTPDTHTTRTPLVTAAKHHPLANSFQWLCSPGILALIIVLTNAPKPVMIDDTAYLTYARQIAVHPLDPYGFTFFWYTVPDDAFEVLCPPVVPYWLALGIRLLGEHAAILKLWMYPFLLLFVWSVRELLKRFAVARINSFLLLIVLSPAILPTVNLFLDVPALALGLTSLVLFMRGMADSSWRLVILSGLAAGLAMQTKYTALLIPPAIVWFGISRWRLSAIKFAAVATGTALLVFSSWELLLIAKYGRSHFAFHASDRQTSVEGGASLAAFLDDKQSLVAPLLGQLGCLGIGVGLAAAMALGIPRRLTGIAAAIWAAGFLWIVLTPASWSSLEGDEPVAASVAVQVFWIASGTFFLLNVFACALRLFNWSKKTIRFRANAEAVFLFGWLLIELGGYFALTPFGAARRVIGLTVIGGIATALASTRMGRIQPSRHLAGWVVAFSIAVGFAVAAIDTLEAFPEKACAERAADLTRERPVDSTVWFAGHWGFQYYCQRAGMTQIVPGESILKPGDLLVLPAYPDELGFYRPHIGSVLIRPPAEQVTRFDEIVWRDPISAQTVPNFYCGIEPVVSRDHPRLRVVVYRLNGEWKVPR